MDATTILSILLAVVGALASWALKSTMDHSNRIAVLESKATSDREESSRRFDEMNEKLTRIEGMLLEALKHRRQSDTGTR